MSEPVVSFIKKSKSRPANARKRAAEEDSVKHSATAPSNGTEVYRPPKRKEANPLIQSTIGYRSKRLKVDNQESSGSEVDEDSKDVGVRYSAKGSINPGRPRSTSPEIRTAEDAALLTESASAKDDKLYRGSKSYTSQLPKAGAKYGAVAGPSNIRTITVTDYQPDVCKDYKETGFCGFGDSCKFLHDRGDYVQGWQLDNMFLSNRPTATAVEPESDEESRLPFACLICRRPFTDPIVTRCGHYFCSACAISRFAKTPKCFACGTPTGGLFNKAQKILDKRDKALEAKRLAEDAESEDGEGEGLEIEGLREATPEPVDVVQIDVAAEEEDDEDVRYFEE